MSALTQKPTPEWLVARFEQIFQELDRLRMDRMTGPYIHRPVSVNQMKRIRNLLDIEIDSAERTK